MVLLRWKLVVKPPFNALAWRYGRKADMDNKRIIVGSESVVKPTFIALPCCAWNTVETDFKRGVTPLEVSCKTAFQRTCMQVWKEGRNGQQTYSSKVGSESVVKPTFIALPYCAWNKVETNFKRGITPFEVSCETDFQRSCILKVESDNKRSLVGCKLVVKPTFIALSRRDWNKVETYFKPCATCVLSRLPNRMSTHFYKETETSYKYGLQT